MYDVSMTNIMYYIAALIGFSSAVFAVGLFVFKKLYAAKAPAQQTLLGVVSPEQKEKK